MIKNNNNKTKNREQCILVGALGIRAKQGWTEPEGTQVLL